MTTAEILFSSSGVEYDFISGEFFDRIMSAQKDGLITHDEYIDYVHALGSQDKQKVDYVFEHFRNRLPAI